MVVFIVISLRNVLIVGIIKKMPIRENAIGGGTARVRESSNADQATPITMNERLLKECNLIYTDSDRGLYCCGFNFATPFFVTCMMIEMC